MVTAGDGSVALAWNYSADASNAGYEYQTRWAIVAWGEWTAIANSDADTTSHSVMGLSNGTEYRSKLRSVNVGETGKPGPQSAPWHVAAKPE